jgi:alpha-glucosidase (family GH31 glycosyl hydrolase)
VKDVGVFTDLDAPLEKINVHVRGGFIIPMQIPGANLMSGRGNPFTLLVAQSALGNATGNLFWDDGDSIGEHISLVTTSIILIFFFFTKIRSKQKSTTTLNFHSFR